MNRKNDNLVFSSVGNYSFHKNWHDKKVNFDLMLVNYSNSNPGFKNDADYYFEHKGSKFQNFHYVFNNYKDVLDKYEQFFIVDDDIKISSSGISALFDIHKKFNLSISQPAFSRRSKISHDITLVNPSYYMRYTNFIELTCPLFSKNSIYKFMEIYNPKLFGYGIDFWFLAVIKNNKNNIAIIDSITCINPYDFTKDKKRQIDLLQDRNTRIKIWHEMQEIYNINNLPDFKITYGGINNSFYNKIRDYIKYFFDSQVGLIYKIENKF